MYVQRVSNPTSTAGEGLSINTAYKVLHRQENGLLTLRGYLMVVGEDQVQPATEEQIEIDEAKWNRDYLREARSGAMWEQA